MDYYETAPLSRQTRCDKNPVFSILDSILSSGIEPPSTIEFDSEIHRFGKKKRSWYVAHLLPVPICIYGDWKFGEKFKYIHSGNKSLSIDEKRQVSRSISVLKRSHQKKLEEQYSQARLKTLLILKQSKPVIFHDYLKAQKILPLGLTEYKHKIAIPVTDGENVHSLQFINSNGQKRFLKGGKTKGMFYQIKPEKKPDKLLMCEGFATGARLYMETKTPVIVTFSANNLVNVAEIIRKRYPQVEILICGDNDHMTEGNPGKLAAIAAAKACQGKWTIPNFNGFSPTRKQTDFNDLYLMQEAASE